MSRYAIQTSDVKNTKKLIKKFGTEISVSNKYVRGLFTIKNFRKYSLHNEVEVEFKGEISVSWRGKKDWYDASLMTKTNGRYKPSIIKVNRFIRKNLMFEVQTHLKYFSVDLRTYNDIQKIKWL
jgi:hypothetical protein